MDIKNEYISSLEQVLESLRKDLATIRLGRASASLVKDIKVMSYGEPTPLEYAASISIPSALQISIVPFDKSQIKSFIETISKLKPELNPQDNGSKIIINIPTLTEEKRKEQVKLIGAFSENAKKKIRNIRHEQLENIKKNIQSINEQDIAKEILQKDVDIYSKRIIEICKEKEESILKI